MKDKDGAAGDEDKKKSEADATVAASSSEDAEKRSSVSDLAKRLSQKGELHMGQHRPSAGGGGVKQTEKKQKRVKVTHSYMPQNEDELRLEVDEIIHVLCQEEEGWCKGRVASSGKEGVFPDNFVTDLEEEGAASAENNTAGNDETDNKPKSEDESSESKAGGKEIQAKKVKGIGLGNIFSGGNVKLKPVATPSPDASIRRKDNPELKSVKESPKESLAVVEDKPVPPPPPKSPVPSLPPRPVRDQAIVQFEYVAENDDELTLKVEDVITILNKDTGDDGWWKGEVAGKVGVFPNNFVRLVAATDDTTKKRSPKDKLPIPPETSAPSTTTTTTTAASSSKPDRPEKPPPPSALASAASKRDKSKDGSKSPVLPPPSIHKKPLGRKERVENEVKPEIKMEVESAEADNDFDTMENNPAGGRLTHLTANRARNPNRRPPSQLFIKEEVGSNADAVVDGVINTTTSRAAPLPVSLSNHKAAPSPDKEEVAVAAAQLTPKAHKPEVKRQAKPPLPPSKPDKPPTVTTKESVAAGDAALSKQVKSLQEELQNTKKVTENLQQKIIDLTDELDEEKKLRRNMQVEIDRIKKLVQKAAVQL